MIVKFKWIRNTLMYLFDGVWFEVGWVQFNVAPRHTYQYRTLKGGYYLGDTAPEGSKFEREIEKGDVIIVVDIPALEGTGERLQIGPYPRGHRVELANLFRYVHSNQLFPRRIVGRIADLEAEKVKLIPTGDRSYFGKCSWCEKEAAGPCVSCQRNCCREHAFLCDLSDNSPLHIYCKECLYFLNLYDQDGVER